VRRQANICDPVVSAGRPPSYLPRIISTHYSGYFLAGIALMNIKEFTEYERIQQALKKSIPVTAIQYEPDIIGTVIGQAEVLYSRYRSVKDGWPV